jgi:tRNA threonylcarbamoyladenosine modification (KEOPS) complex  Pcc1 subunit
MSLKCQVQVVLDNISREKAMAIKKALDPDNVDFPKELKLDIKNTDSKLVLNFESKDGIKKLIGTIDEVLEHVQVSLKVIEEC